MANIPPCFNQGPGYLPNYSEDCLRLVVERPAGTPADAKLPVLIYIHGGGFTDGYAMAGPLHLYRALRL